MKRIFLLSLLTLLFSQSYASLRQVSYRWRNDDGDEANATWKANLNTPVTVNTPGEVLRLRILLDNDNEEGENSVSDNILQYSFNNGATWVTMTNAPTNHFVYANSAFVTNNAPTTTQITSGFSFVPGIFMSSTSTGSINVGDGEYTEYEFCITPTATAIPFHKYLFRMPTPEFEGDYIKLAELNTGCMVVSPTPPVNLGPNSAFCNSFTLDAGDDYASYVWNDNSTDDTLHVTAEGSYYVTVTDDLGCVTTDTITLTLAPPPTVNIGNDGPSCPDDNNTITLNAGNPGASYLWDDGSTNQYRVIDQNGTYYVTVTTGLGCVNSDTVSKVFLPLPIVNLGGDTTICDGVELTLDGGTDGTQYFWNTGSNEQTITVDHSGMYFVIVTNSDGCDKADSVLVTVSGTMPSIGSIIVDNVGAYTFRFSVYNPQGGLGQYNWDFGDNTPINHEVNPIHTYQDVGNYQVTLSFNTESCGLLSYNSSIHILGVDDIITDDKLIVLYPNPTKDYLYIKADNNLKVLSYDIINILGQNVKQGVFNYNNTKVDMSEFPSGIYNVKLKTDRGYLIRKINLLK